MAAEHCTIAPHFARGMPVDVVTLSLDRAAALVQLVESYLVDGGEDERHAVPVDPDKPRLVVAMIDEHVCIASEAMQTIGRAGVHVQRDHDQAD